MYICFTLPLLTCITCTCKQPASSDSWRSVFFTMAGVLAVATLVFWMTGCGQRQWWAIYVEMPAAAAGTDAVEMPTVATAASDAAAGRAASDVNKKADEKQPETTDKTMMDSARDIFASFSFMRQQQQRQRQQQQQQKQQELSLD